MKILIALCAVIVLAAALTNTPPINSRQVGHKEGKGQRNIHYDYFYDLWCADCVREVPIFWEFMDSKVNGELVSDMITVTWHILPLPYHHQVWLPH